MNNYQKSSLFAYNTASQTVATNGTILFNNFKQTGCSIKLETNNTAKISKPGLYSVNVSVSAAQSDTTGSATIQLFNNGVAVPGAISSADTSSATDVEVLTFSTVVQVNPNCAAVTNNCPVNLTVVNTGVATTITNPIITIVKEA